VRALIAGTFAQQLGLSALVEVVLRIAPLLGAFATFTCVYLVLPNARARFVSTLIGGCVAGALWILALLLYVQLQIGVANYNAIYAGFAVLPIFLVWVQISWVIVLLGAELAFAHEYEPDYRGMASYQALGHGALERVALRAMARIGAAFLAGDRPRSPAALAADLGISPQPVEEVLEMLVRADLLVAVAEQDTPGSEGYVLACDPSRITIKRILDALKLGEGDAGVSRSRGAGDEELDRLLGRIEAEVEGSAFNLNLRDLVQRVERGRVLPGSAEVERAEIQPS